MTLLTINIEKIGLKDAGQCIDPYITVSVKGNDFCSWLLVSSLERVRFLKAVLIFQPAGKKIFVGTCIFYCRLKASALNKGGKILYFERYWEVSHCRRHAYLCTPGCLPHAGSWVLVTWQTVLLDSSFFSWLLRTDLFGRLVLCSTYGSPGFLETVNHSPLTPFLPCH